MANEIRRYFYLLTVLSLVGSVDYLLTLFSANQTRYSLIEYLSANIAAKYVDFHKITFTTCMAIVICYIIAYIVTLIMSRFDVDVYMKYNFTSTAISSWADQALADSTFTERLDQWEALDRIRLVVVLLAWLAGCALLWMDISRYSKLWLNLKM
ncbi:hypothetical protein EON65_07745 [archaeon]|nr:MAG: hypothetical protein EON65_07745 [archaeon]